jgi:uncharacterized membrane protein
MDALALARALHVLAVVHWIGGVAMVTLVILPAVAARADPAERLALFEAVEGRFAAQARVSVTLAGATGFWMTWALGLWDRFADPAYWWMHAMTAVWALFTLVLFVAEPLFLHAWFRRRAIADPEGAFRLVLRGHRALLALSAATIGATVYGVHGPGF